MSNDMIILGTLLTLFIGVGFFIGNVNDAFGTTYDGAVTDTSISSQDEGDVTTVSAWKVLGSVVSMFFWTFGVLPLWLDLCFLVFRTVFWATLARNIWIGGGS